MEYHVIPHSLPGHPDCKSIRIITTIRNSGDQNIPTQGSPSLPEAFPDTATSQTAKKDASYPADKATINQLTNFDKQTDSCQHTSLVVVHHKTEFGSNLTGHGFPDPGHLDNVLEELRAQYHRGRRTDGK
ncbi:unnamed protein product [Pleuronectes platessa]|uniref:E3 ubiquitin-protein ligase n=1 Tax=Pleuronectes platessa TaxID=8262 RepID=A0A9N7UMD3_PLEPL|nr:unnamed protein product [Pleuronectes platessa]